MTLMQIAVEAYQQKDLEPGHTLLFVRLPHWRKGLEAEVIRTKIGQPMPTIYGQDNQSQNGYIICPISLHLWLDGDCVFHWWSPSADEFTSGQWDFLGK